MFVGDNEISQIKSMNKLKLPSLTAMSLRKSLAL
jgi:hypothetical protein